MEVQAKDLKVGMTVIHASGKGLLNIKNIIVADTVTIQFHGITQVTTCGLYHVWDTLK